MDERQTKTQWLARLAPWGFFALKVLVSIYALYAYIPRYVRLTYIADGPARGVLAYSLAFGKPELFQTHQWQPFHLWIWAALLRLYPDIYWTGTALNVAAGAGATLFLYLLGRQLAGPVAGSVAALAFIFSPVHHNLTLSEGMTESLFFFWVAAGVYAASRGATGKRGAAAAGFCLAAAALTRYEGALLLILYSGYRLLRQKPRGVAGWLLWGAPLALAGTLLGHRAFLGAGRGFWPALSGVKADMACVLTNLHWYRRTYYGLERLWLDGRVVAVLGVLGAVMVWARRVRNESRLLVWAGAAVLFAALSAIFVIVGVGFCPERHFSIVLMLLFPFTGLAAVEVWRRAKRRAAKAAVALGLAAAAAYTAYFDSAIRDYGYGHPGPCCTCLSVDAELALKLRELWRRGELEPNEIIYLEENRVNYNNYAIQTYSNHPLNFFTSPAWQTERDLWYLPYVLKANDVRVAIFVNARSRHQIKSFYQALKKDAVIFEDPAHTVVVLREGWRHGVPDLSLKVSTDYSKVIR